MLMPPPTLQAVVPDMTSEQVKSPVLPALRLLLDGGSVLVASAAIGAVSVLFTSVTEQSCVDEMNKEMLHALERGPKPVRCV